MDNLKIRVHEIRKHLKLNQEDFDSKLGITKSSVSNMESGRYNVTDAMIKLICATFNINEDWLRTGNGQMEMQSDTFSLDEYAKQKGLTDLEKGVMASYMMLDKEVRKSIMEWFGRLAELVNEYGTVNPNEIIQYFNPEGEKEPPTPEHLKELMVNRKMEEVQKEIENKKAT